MKQAAERAPKPDVIGRALRKLKVITEDRLSTRDSHVRSKHIFDVASDPAVLSRLEELLGPDILLWVGLVRNRPPGNPGQGFHRDRINVLVDGIHTTVALTEMTKQNGCIHLIPGSHKYDISLQQSRREGQCDLHDWDSVLRLADKVSPQNAPHEIVRMELRPGEFFFGKSGFWHSVSSNISNQTRYALAARYMKPDKITKHWHDDDATVKVVKNASLPCILVKGKDHHGLNRLYPPPH